MLRDAGLMKVRIEGSRRLYRVDFEGIKKLRAELDAFWETSLEALTRTVESKKKK